MNKTAAMAQVNPQAQEMSDMARGTTISLGASYDTALGFVSSCHGVSCLAHYSLMPGEETVSRKACAREIKKKLHSFMEIKQFEAMIEVFVNRHNEECASAMFMIPNDVYEILASWENEWQSKLGAVDNDS